MKYVTPNVNNDFCDKKMTEILVKRRKISKNKVYCAVPGCNNKSHKNLDVTFHYFPKPDKRFVYKENQFGVREKVDQHDLWKSLIKVKNVNSFTKICSEHFVPDDYVHPYDEGVKKFLKKYALPSRNLPNVDPVECEKKIEKNEQRLKRRARREETKQKIKIEEFSVEIKEEVLTESEEFTDPVECEKKIEKNEQGLKTRARREETNQNIKIEESSVQIKEEVLTESEEFTDNQSVIGIEHIYIKNEYSASCVQEASTENVEIQVNSGDFRTKFIDQLKSDADLSTATGIESFALLETILDIVQIADLKKDDSVVTMNVKDRVILTLVKLKQNLSYAFLSILFNCTDKHCQRIFSDTIVLLSTCLKQFIAWPTKEDILRNMPACLAGFENVRVVVDCTEIYIQNKKNQILTYSHYKRSQTCKVMTCVTPAGSISFVSKVYDGRCSDKSIFEQSEIIKLCESGDAVMVDRGFLIDDICDLYGIKCIRTPFLKDKTQFSKSDAILMSKIAKARVHVERSNQKIKMFQMMGDTFPTDLVPLLHDIFTVVCAVVNLNAPIMKEDKFMDT